jgi:hypothetical protein
MSEPEPAERIQQFHEDFFKEVLGTAEAEQDWAADVFFDLFCSQLVEASEIETADRCHYQSQQGVRIDGCGGDPRRSEGRLTLIVSDFHPSIANATLTATELKKAFKRARSFLTKALDPGFREKLDWNSPVCGLCEMIASRWPDVEKVRILLISNRQLSTRIKGHESDEQDGRPVSYAAWDLSRLHSFVTGGQALEPIEIDFSSEDGGGLPVLPAHLGDAGYASYLAVMRGDTLARIYDQWGTRLLERNVRVFLTTRTKVNKGMQTTLETCPEMFFAYNNGLTATAEAVQVEGSEGALRIRGIRNLQIVNGGQTTASVFAARRNKEIDLSKVFVQMKLSVVSADDARELVPSICRFANTQNKISGADFFSNHPYHVRIEKFSRRLVVPAADGTFQETKWFYERARGQYQNARSGKTIAQRRQFDLSFPKRQMFTKTDLAKFMLVWEQEPHVVSKGAQHCFARYATLTDTRWMEDDRDYNEAHFREIVAKAILFRHLERSINPRTLAWYDGGYRANIVAYSLSKLAQLLESRKEHLDFDLIWRNQAISEPLQENLLAAARTCHEILVSPPGQTRNVTEWAKKVDCWRKVKETPVPWPHPEFREVMDRKAARQVRSEARREQSELNGIEAQALVVATGAEFWRRLLDWETGRGILLPRERSILEVCTALPVMIPSDKQALSALESYRKLVDEGCPHGLPDPEDDGDALAREKQPVPV